MSTISASTTSTTAYKVDADTTGELAFQTGATPTTALTLDASQNATFAGTVEDPTGTLRPLVSRTAIASTSGTSVSFTDIPSWAKKITIIFQNVSTTGTSNVGIQLGTGATPTYTTTGYASNGNVIAGSAVGSASYTTLFGLGSTNQIAASSMQGTMTLSKINGNGWVFTGTTSQTNTNATHFGNGSITLGAALTAIRVTTVLGTDTFDAGLINIFYE